MKIDISNLSEKELLSLQNSIGKALVKFERQRKSAARKAIAAEARKHGFSLGELVAEAKDKPTTASKPRAKAKKPAPAKYRDPKNADNTWSGKGRRPAWYKAAVDAGIDPETLEI